MAHVALHDATRKLVAISKSSTEECLKYLEINSDRGSFDQLSHIIFTEVTGESHEPSEDSPIAARYFMESDVEEEFLSACIVEPTNDGKKLQLTPNYMWAMIDEAFLDRLEKKYQFLLVEAERNISSETSTDSVNNAVPLFSMPGAVEKIRRSIISELRRCGHITEGPVKQVRSGPDSMIFFVRTDKCLVFYKISGHGSPEAVIAETLAKFAPMHVVLPFGDDRERNSFFTKDFGCTLILVLSLEDDDASNQQLKREFTTKVAKFHIDVSTFVEKLKDAGIEDTSPAKMKKELPAFVRQLQEKGILEQDVVGMNAILPRVYSMLNTLVEGRSL